MDQVILAFEGEKNSRRIQELLEGAGVAECLVCHSAAEVKRLAGERHITAILCGYKLRDETAENLYEDLAPNCSMLVIAAQSMLELIGRREIAVLSAPAARSDLLSSVEALLAADRRRERPPQRSAEEQALVESAKQVLMDRRGMSEGQAHRFLQKRSMDSGLRLAQAARQVLDGIAGD